MFKQDLTSLDLPFNTASSLSILPAGGNMTMNKNHTLWKNKGHRNFDQPDSSSDSPSGLEWIPTSDGLSEELAAVSFITVLS